MSRTIRNVLTIGLINRYREHDKFMRFVSTVTRNEAEPDTVPFLLAVNKGLNVVVDDSATVPTVLRQWYESVLREAKEHEVDAYDFGVDWEPIVIMYESRPDLNPDIDPVRAAGAALGVKFEEPKVESSGPTMAEIDVAALKSLKDQYAAQGVAYINDQFGVNDRPMVLAYLQESILDQDVVSKLNMEYERFAHGPEAAVVGNDPMSVEHYKEGKRQFESDLDSHELSVSSALRRIDWTHSLLGYAYWQQQIDRYKAVA